MLDVQVFPDRLRGRVMGDEASEDGILRRWRILVERCTNQAEYYSVAPDTAGEVCGEVRLHQCETKIKHSIFAYLPSDRPWCPQRGDDHHGARREPPTRPAYAAPWKKELSVAGEGPSSVRTS